MKGTPAEAAGLQVNDFILKVDGKPVSSGDEAAALIRGPAGTEVVLTIYRDGDTFDVTIVREDITIPAVDYSMMDDGIGYIELITFNERSALAMTEAMLALDSQGQRRSSWICATTAAGFWTGASTSPGCLYLKAPW